MRIDSNRVNPASGSLDVTLPRTEPVSTSVEAKEVKDSAPPANPRVPGSESTKAPDLADLEYAAEKMNKAVRVFNQTLQFEVTKANRIVIRVIDQDSGEIIRQIPPEEFMDSFHKVEDALGVLIDRRV